MKCAIGAAVLAAAWLGSALPSQAEIRLSINEGVVSLTATDATVPQILAEWGRVGRTTIINGERIPGGPVTLELTTVPEDRALDTLLRSTAGYLAAPRSLTVPNASRFDRIIILPTSVAPRGGPAPQPALQQPAFQAPAFVPQTPPGQGEENEVPQPPPGMPVPPAGGFQPARPPGFGTFPAAGGPVQGPAGDPTAVMPPRGLPGPALPVGSATPGVIIQPPAPQQPQQPGPRPQGP
jgi:hypothetical protein